MLTFGQAKQSRSLARVSGVCGTSDEFMDYLNKSVRMLMTRGNFWGTVQLMRFCIHNECLVWPRQVGTVLAVNTCGTPINVWNNWFQFTHLASHREIQSLGFTVDGFACRGNLAMENQGTTPVYFQVPCGKNFYVRSYPAVRADVGNKVTIFGLDSNGQVVRTKTSSGIWQEGVTITNQIPFASTPMRFREVTRVLRDKTSGPGQMFYYDPDNDVLQNCAIYDPTDVTPDFRFTKLPGLPHANCCSAANGVKQVAALVKLQFIPVENDNDLVLISNLDAIGSMIQAIRMGDAGDIAGGRAGEQNAVHELNLELRDRFPVSQTPISIRPAGAVGAFRANIGMI